MSRVVERDNAWFFGFFSIVVNIVTFHRSGAPFTTYHTEHIVAKQHRGSEGSAILSIGQCVCRSADQDPHLTDEALRADLLEWIETVIIYKLSRRLPLFWKWTSNWFARCWRKPIPISRANEDAAHCRQCAASSFPQASCGCGSSADNDDDHGTAVVNDNDNRSADGILMNDGGERGARAAHDPGGNCLAVLHPQGHALA